MNVERITYSSPGHDCISNPCGKNGCGTSPGASHGIGSETWCFSIVDREAGLALSFRVFTSKYPESVPHHRRAKTGMPRGAGVALHSAFPIREDDIRSGGAPEACELLGKCYAGDVGYLVGDNRLMPHFLEAYGIDGQSEAFWGALTALFSEWSSTEDVVLARTAMRCACCNGTGIVQLAAPKEAR